jgi:hypothetical protein
MEDVERPPKGRLRTTSEKIEARDRSDAAARESIEDERRRREEKSEKLRKARLRSVQQTRRQS